MAEAAGGVTAECSTGNSWLDRGLRWSGYAWCALTGGHEFLVERTAWRVTRRCWHCGYAGAGGWWLWR